MKNAEQFVYRGIHAGHPALADARQGRVVPGDLTNTTVTPAMQNAGGYAAHSPYTSWTHDLAIARDFANLHGPGGVVLRLPTDAPLPGADWAWVPSPDEYQEKEVLLLGIRENAAIMEP